MFRNLLAEMARSNLTGKDVSRMVKMDYGTWRNKMNGKTEFTCNEMFIIRNAVFPGMTRDYLFGEPTVAVQNTHEGMSVATS